MTDEERLAKLAQAVALIREVEFSYPRGSDERKLQINLTKRRIDDET